MHLCQRQLHSLLSEVAACIIESLSYLPFCSVKRQVVISNKVLYVYAIVMEMQFIFKTVVDMPMF